MLDAVENMTLPALLDSRKVEKSRINQMINDLGLKGREHHLPNQLSGGQQQRVSIADEPNGNLDSKNSQEIMNLLRLSNEKYHQTLIIITHDEEIANQAKHLIRIEDGRICRDEVIR